MDWSELPEDLVVLIGERLTLYADYVRFRSVCVSWNSALLHNHHPLPGPSQQQQFFPFLFLPSEDHGEDKRDTCSRGLLSIPENRKIYHLHGFPKKQFKSMFCPGSSHGWLVIVEEAILSMYLINPFTRAQLPLPPMTIFRNVLEYQPYEDQATSLIVEKIVLSSSPSYSSSSDVVAIAIFGGSTEGMAFSRPGDKEWTCFSSDTFADVLFYRDHIYAVRGNSLFLEMNKEILVYHMGMDNGGGGPVPKLVDTIKQPEGYQPSWRPYLVESCGDLLMIARVVEETAFKDKTIGFKVFKLCSDDENKTSTSTLTWVVIEKLDDIMIFLGVNSSLSVSTHDFPSECCRGNCIYFTHHHDLCDHYYVKQGWGYDINQFDMGVFNMENKCIEPFSLQYSFCGHSIGRFCPPPIWLIPNPN